MDESKKDIHANVGFTISSTPDKTEITRPHEAPAVTRAQFPFRIVFVSDLMPEQKVADWESGSHLHPMDRNAFLQSLSDLAPTLTLDVENRLQLQPRKLDLSLEFRSLSDFQPDGIVRLVPILTKLWSVRNMVTEVGRGAMSIDAFKSNLGELGIDEEWSAQLYAALSRSEEEQAGLHRPTGSDATGSAAQKTALDNIFEMVEFGSEEPTTEDPEIADDSPRSLADAFVAALGAEDSINTKGARRIVKDIESKVSRQVQTILHHDRFRELESKWRGLKLLVDQLDFRSNIRLEVLPVGNDDIAEALHYQIVLPEHEGRPDTPASLLVFDRAFGYGAADMEALTEIAGTAESIQTPAIASLSPGFFGYEKAEDLGDLPVIWQHLQRPEYIEWNRFTESSEAAYVSLALPPILLREPYESTTAENGLSINEDQFLWGGASVATAAIITRRFTETGWPTLITGRGDHQLEELPLWNSSKGPIPLSATWSSGKQGELADEGFTVLGCLPGNDYVYLQQAPTASRFRTYEDEEMTRKARALRYLDAQLFISGIVHFLLREQSALTGAIPASDAGDVLEKKLRSLMGITDDPDADRYASVTIASDGETNENGVLDVSVQSPPSILKEPVGFKARIPVAREV